MASHRRRWFNGLWVACVLVAGVAIPAQADEIWVAPTQQQDLGGLSVASNAIWPVTPVGAVRLAWAVPNDLQTFQSAKIVLVPHAPGGVATLNVLVCAAQNGNLVGAACAGPFTQAFTGVVNQLSELEIGPMLASRIGAPGANYLAVLAYTTPSTATDHLVGLRFAYAPKTPAGVATLGANTFTGTQTAPAFVGDGSGLTNLPGAAGGATLGANTFTGTQTAPAFVGDGIGLSGVAKSGANTFSGTQTINTGNLDLDPSTAAMGNLSKNGTPFLHNFGSANTFLGLGAGNFTMTGTNNTATGFNALFAAGAGCCNTATGGNALFVNTSGSGNTATGLNALVNNTSGQNNTAMGVSALGSNTTGVNNVAIGFAAGLNATTGFNNIYLGTSTAGVAGESNTMYLGSNLTKAVIAGVRGTTVSGGQMVVIDAAGRLGSAASNTVTGNINLDDSTATTGNITKNGTLFLHNFGGSGIPGAHNTFLGEDAGLTITTMMPDAHTYGIYNTGNGAFALLSATTGDGNTATGMNALDSVTEGSHNTAIGDNAGADLENGSWNIYLGAYTFGTPGESNTMYLGSTGFAGPTRSFIAGVRGTTTGSANAIPVVIDSAGQLGTISSSRRFKEDIHDMADASRRLLQLRPVTFRFTQAYGDGSKPIQYGLIAEEVAEAFPELAVRNADGDVETVHYETLNVLLLNELQKQDQRAEAQAQLIDAQERRMAALERLIGQLTTK